MNLQLVRSEPDDEDLPENGEVDGGEDFGGEEDLDFGDAEGGGGTEPLFPGDLGVLPRAVREALVAIQKRRYIAADRHADLWRVVEDNEPMLQSRLNDMFLELVIDPNYRIAYKRQATSETGVKFPTLVYDKEWNREETILLVFLRRQIRTDQQAGGLGSFVDRSDLVEEVRQFRAREATNQSADDARARNGVDALVKAEVLLRTDTEDRYRISPVIEVLLPVDRVKALGAWLIDQNDGAVPLDAEDIEETDPNDSDDPDDLSDAAADEETS